MIMPGAQKVVFESCDFWVILFWVILLGDTSEGNLCLYCCLERTTALPNNDSNQNLHSLYMARLKKAYEYPTSGGVMAFLYTCSLFYAINLYDDLLL